MPSVFTERSQVNANFFNSLESISERNRIIMCAPKYFDVIDVKNAHMQGNVGKVNQSKANEQWSLMKTEVQKKGFEVLEIDPTPELEDMVFTANPAFAGEDVSSRPVALLSNMKHESRKKEVPAFHRWFEEQNYRVVQLKTDGVFEGNGDGIWHWTRKLIWGGYGFRTDLKVYEEISDIFGAPVVAVKLINPNFYHLDTCLCPMSEEVALYCKDAFDENGLELLHELFPKLIDVPFDEAKEGFACNSLVLGNTVFINQGNQKTIDQIRVHGFDVVELDTSEFLKSGGSVCCMKLKVF